MLGDLKFQWPPPKSQDIGELHQSQFVNNGNGPVFDEQMSTSPNGTKNLIDMFETIKE